MLRWQWHAWAIGVPSSRASAGTRSVPGFSKCWAGLGSTSHCVNQNVDLPTAVYFKDYDGERTVVHYYRSGSAAASMRSDDVDVWVDRPIWFHVTGVFAALSPDCMSIVDELLDRRMAVGGLVSFDVNHRPTLWGVAEAASPLIRLARRSDVVFVGRDEAEALWGVDDVQGIRELLWRQAEQQRRWQRACGSP